MSKRKVYFFESNVPMDKVIYLPLVSGILQSYAQTFKVLDEAYEFMPYIFMRDTPENMIKDIKDPAVMAFSVCIWNHQLSLAVASLVKERYPKCQIVFGGPQVLSGDKMRYPFIDHIIQEEGEKKFVTLLATLIGQEVDCKGHNLSNYPSPYTLGLYDRYQADYPEMKFQAIVETNRGCPFTCTFCYWGQGFEEKKVRHHDLHHVREEAEWIGKNKIPYVFMADANFGMYDRDYEVAKIYCEVKEKYGFPERVRVCYGKNKTENVYKVAKLMHEYGLGKAVTLARQSNNEVALGNIRRSNIKLNVYDELRERYAKDGIPTYTEIILGLPGETKTSFIAGVNEVAGTETQLFIYHCTVLPNTEMANPEYIAKHGIKTVRVPLTEIHGQIRDPRFVVELEDVIVETATMSQKDWIECAVFSWETQLEHVFEIELTLGERGRIRSSFLDIAIGVTQGRSRAQIDTRYGNIYWEPEEMAYLNLLEERNEIEGDPKEFAKQRVLWGRKSKVHKKVVHANT